MAIKTYDREFHDHVEEELTNTFMRRAVATAQDNLRVRKMSASTEDVKFGDWEEWRNAAAAIRQHTLENLDYYLQQLSENVAKRGGHVFFAATVEEANEYIEQVVKEKEAKTVVKTKSMVTEELGLNSVLEGLGCDVLETDLGEYILQVSEDIPSHFVAPALHLNKEQVRDVYQEKIGYTGTESPDEITSFTRVKLREKFLQAEVGITGCNFAVAESGTVTLVTNEGNANMTTSLPKTQISIMGMERIVPTWSDLDVVVSMLCRSAVGQKLSTYVTAVSPDMDENTLDAPRDFHLVILDGGRSNALGTEFQEALHCIRCAACVNVCPVYRHIGGHAYGSVYQGPIGAVLSPILGGYDDHQELPYASSLCGACTEACPVKIPLHDLLVRHREHITEIEGKSPLSEKMMMKGFGAATTSNPLFNLATKAAPLAMGTIAKDGYITKGPGPLKDWTASRDFPAPPKDNFRKWFEARDKGENS